MRFRNSAHDEDLSRDRTTNAPTLIADKYRLGATIGRGAVGVVYSATHVETNQRVAIKLLQLGLDDISTLLRFRREARAASRIEHEHVAQVLDAGEHENQPFLVMEYLEGQDLEAVLLDGGPLPITEAVGYAIQACSALAAAHLQGVVHRDIKPANLFLARRPDGSSGIKLVDFGISKIIDPAHVETSITIGFVGSPQYMAPEQLKKGVPIDGGCDIWALGVTLYELLANTSPFAAASVPLLCVSILKDPPASLRAHRNDVPEALEAVILRCLAKHREDRYATVAELADALRPFAPSLELPSIAMPACDPVDEIEACIERFGGRDCVLELAMTMFELTQMPLDHRAGFLLSRVDGISTLEDLLDVSGMSTFETLRLLGELYDQRVIAPLPRIALSRAISR